MLEKQGILKGGVQIRGSNHISQREIGSIPEMWPTKILTTISSKYTELLMVKQNFFRGD